MTSNRPNKFANMTPRQKIIAIAFILVLLFIIWQVKGLFGSGSSKHVADASKSTTTAMTATGPQEMSNMPQTPRPTPLPDKQASMSPREIELLKLQQETQAKYISALNELQMLKVQREIAEANQAIMSAKLATVTAQKNIVDTLAPPAPQISPDTYAKNLSGQTTLNIKPNESTTPDATTPAANYAVISVSQLNYRWSAVLGYQGNLYHVSVGDVLPTDNSKVIAIDKNGVILLKDGQKKRYSLVPII